MCLLYSNRMDGQFSVNLPLDTQIRRFALVMMTPLGYWQKKTPKNNINNMLEFVFHLVNVK